MVDNSIQIKKLQPGDIGDAMGLVLAEGWNQTEKDWKILAGDPRNVAVAAVVEGKIIGTATAINYGNKVAWVGMVLVSKAFRGRGISKILLSSLFEGLKSCASVKLDATPAGQPVYMKLGFEDEYMINRMVCISFGKTVQSTDEAAPQRLQKEDLPAVIDLDKQAFGADRSQLLNAFFANFPEKCFVLKNNGQVTGFAMGRKGNKYHHIGPVTAGSSHEASLLITHVLKYLQGQSIVIDVLNDKNEFTQWLTSLGFEKQRHFFRMYLKDNLFPGQTGLQYLICGPEFG